MEKIFVFFDEDGEIVDEVEAPDLESAMNKVSNISSVHSYQVREKTEYYTSRETSIASIIPMFV